MHIIERHKNMIGGPNQCQQNASVYVIEDDIPTGELITQVLKRIGYTVRVFYNAEQAYNVISTEISTFHHVHIVILDAVLNHKKDGVWNQKRQTESAERFIVKMTNTFPRTRIILMSGEISARFFF